MIRDDRIAEEINELWGPVYPYMVDHLTALTKVRSGAVLDLGPFAGGMAVELLGRFPHLRATVHDGTEGVLHWARDRASSRGVSDRLATGSGPLAPLAWPDAEFDLVLVRGAFFFLTPPLLSELARVLRPGGFGWVGGGYGPRTPQDVIALIGERSKRLNEALGKKRVSSGEAAHLVEAAGLGDRSRVVADGGLWIEVRP